MGERRPRDVCTDSPKCDMDVGTVGFEAGFDAGKIVEDELV